MNKQTQTYTKQDREKQADVLVQYLSFRISAKAIGLFFL